MWETLVPEDLVSLSGVAVLNICLDQVYNAHKCHGMERTFC